MGFNFRDQIGTGDEACFESRAGEAAGGFQVRRGDERDMEVRGFHEIELHRTEIVGDIEMVERRNCFGIQNEEMAEKRQLDAHSLEDFARHRGQMS